MPALGIRDVDPSQKDNKGPTIVAVTTVFMIIAIITTALRLWVRKARRALGWDDYTITMAMVLAIVYCGILYKGVERGKGKRGKYLTKTDTEFINMYSWIGQHFLFSSMALVKISVCLLVTRITNSKKMKILTAVVMTILVASALECSIVLLAQCKPVKASWRPAAGKCWPAKVRIYSIYVQAAIACTTDLLCSLLPIVIMWNVQLPLKKKVSIWALMALGLVCTGCSAVRAKSLDAKAKDLAYDYAIVAIWAIAELNLGIIATNLGLSRAMYYYFVKPDEMTQNASKRTYGSRSRSGYSQHPDTQKSTFSHTTSKIKRNSSMARSEDSEIPLKPVAGSNGGIEKKTEIEMHVH